MTRPTVAADAETPWERRPGAPPAAGRWKLLLGGERTPTEGITTGISELAPGTEPTHAHRHDPPEVYFGLAGHGAVEIDGEHHDLSVGAAVYIPGGALHRPLNPGGEPLRFLWVFPTDTLGEVVYHHADGSPPRRIELA